MLTKRGTISIAREVQNFYRTLVTATKNKEVNGSNSEKPKRLKRESIPKEMQEYFESQERQDVLRLYPESVLKKKKKAPEAMYNTNEKLAEFLASTLKKDLRPHQTLLEVHPGLGSISKQLISGTSNDILLFEPEAKFHGSLSNLINKKTTGGRKIVLKPFDLTTIWRLAFVDKLDQGSRVDEMLKGTLKTSFEDEPNARLFASTCSLSLMRHLVNSVVFQNSLMSFGRCELYLCVNPILYMHLTCSSSAGYMLYRATSVLFQILFEHEFICKLNRKDFLPWQSEAKLISYTKLGKFNSVDSDHLYFIKAVPRQNLHLHVLPENLPALWYFVKQHFTSRKNRVIPTLERWIPNCGPRLIVNKSQRKVPELVYKNIDVNQLPQFSKPSTTLTKEDFADNMDIYTEFGDLTPSQVLTLFDQFITWPEFKDCSFSASLESALIKLHTSPEDSVDSLEMAEDDDESKTSKAVTE